MFDNRGVTKMEEFENSIDATEFVEKLQQMLNDKRLANWCKSTDYIFDVQSSHPLAAAQHAVTLMVRQLDNAC